MSILNRHQPCIKHEHAQDDITFTNADFTSDQFRRHVVQIQVDIVNDTVEMPPEQSNV